MTKQPQINRISKNSNRISKNSNSLSKNSNSPSNSMNKQPTKIIKSNNNFNKNLKFKQFLINNNLLSLTIYITLGFATKDLIKSFADNILVKLVQPLFSHHANLEYLTLNVGPFHLGIGKFIGSLLYYLSILYISFLFLIVLKQLVFNTIPLE